MSKNILSYHHNSSSFTLIELLISISILAILMSITAIAMNPSEMIKRSRDTKRFNDISNLQMFLTMARSEGLLNSTICDGTKIYVSLPNSISLSNTNLPAGVSWVQVSEDNLRKSNGTGWIPINLSGSYTSGFSMASLPVDPQNTLNDNLYYTFYCNPQQEYILTSYMESKTFGPKGNETSKTNKDGGPDPYLYEVGSNLFISPLKPVGSWSFDEGTGTIVNDSSGNNNNGTLYNGPIWTDGQVNKTLSFDGVDDYVDCGNDESLNITDAITIEGWFQSNEGTNYGMIISKMTGWRASGYWMSYDKGLYIFNVGKGSDYQMWGASASAGAEWTHITGTFTKDGQIKIYKNGVLVQSQNVTGGIISLPTTKLVMAAYKDGLTGGPWAFNGLIDEVRIYNRALSAEEIKRHYEMSK